MAQRVVSQPSLLVLPLIKFSYAIEQRDRAERNTYGHLTQNVEVIFDDFGSDRVSHQRCSIMKIVQDSQIKVFRADPEDVDLQWTQL